jgi:hypothetical protein
MRGGIGLRALYLNKKHSIGYKKFAKMSVARFSTIFLVDSILGLIAATLLLRTEGLFNRPILLVLGITLIIAVLIHGSTRFAFEEKFRFLKRAVGSSISLLRVEGVRKSLIMVTLLNSLSRFLWIVACFHAISVDLTLYQGLLISSLIPLSMIVTLTTDLCDGRFRYRRVERDHVRASDAKLRHRLDTDSGFVPQELFREDKGIRANRKYGSGIQAVSDAIER